MKKFFLFLSLLSLSAPPADARPGVLIRPADIVAQLQRAGRVELSTAQLVIERYDFETGGAKVEAIVTRPLAEGKHPGLVLIPGHSRTAADMLPMK